MTNPRASRSGCLHYALFFIACLYVIALTLATQLVAWVTDQVLLIQSVYLPWFSWVLVSLGEALALALFILPLAAFVRTPRWRAIYQTWAGCVAFIAGLAIARAFSAMQLQAELFASILLTLTALAVLPRYLRARSQTWPPRGNTVSFALLTAPLVVAPMIAVGALGSPLDTILGLAAGLSLGAFAGLLFEIVLFRPLAVEAETPSPWVLGFAVGVALTILASGFGAPGTQFVLMAILPGLGFLIAALRGAWISIAALVGAVASAALIFFDPTELALVLGLTSKGELLFWAVRAAGGAWLIALALGVFALIAARRSRPAQAWVWSGAAVVWAATIAIYLFAGRPGFYGEQLFVILKEQADLSGAPAIAERTDRLRYVYTALTEQAQRSQSNLRTRLDTWGIDYHPYYLVNAMEVDGGPLLRAYLVAQPEVDRVIASPHLRPLPQPLESEPGALSAPSEVPWNIKAIHADRVWSELGVTGKGIVVGQSDTGVQGDHPALASGYRGLVTGDDYNWLDPWNGTPAPTDIEGHGTHTLGTILGHGGIGVAPDAEWFACVNLARNLGNPPLYLDCLQFMLAPYPRGGNPLRDGDPARAAHVLNNSWGCPPLEGCDAVSLQPAVDALRAAGIFVVASAGNNGPRCASLIEPPAIYRSAFSVGAIGPSGSLSLFSSRGPVTVDGSQRVKPDIVAPGEAIISAAPQNTYASHDGTSMAGPHVVGVVALMWSANSKLIGDISRTEKILRETAQAYNSNSDACAGTELPNNAIGYGVVDSYAAVAAALAVK